MKKELVELYHIPENKIDVIYPPINTDKFTQINEEERVKLREKLGFKKMRSFTYSLLLGIREKVLIF